MRGDDLQQGTVFSYVSAEQRIPASHPLRSIRQMTDAGLRDLSIDFDELYARVGRQWFRKWQGYPGSINVSSSSSDA
jgi:hypothetical protein